MARIAVLGGGFAGLKAAFVLERTLPQEHSIWLIDREDDFVFHPSLIWVVTGERTLPQVTLSRRRLLQGRRIRFLERTITALHPQERQVETDDGHFPFDFAVVALGQGAGEEAITGLSAANHHPCLSSRVLAFRQALEDLRGGTLLFVNAPGVGYSFPLLEMLLAVEGQLRRQGRRNAFELVYADGGPAPDGEGGEGLGTRISSLLKRRRIRTLPDWHLARVEAGRAFDLLGRSLDFDLLMAMPPRSPQAVVAGSPLGDADGWPRADLSLRSLLFPRLYVAGDGASLGTPKGGFLAEAAGGLAARNLATAVTGKGKQRFFPGRLVYLLDTADGSGILVSRPFYRATAPLLLQGPVVHWGKAAFEGLFLHTPIFTRWG